MSFIVVYDDDDCLRQPMTLDQDCEGALCCGEPVALFESIKAARKAISISKKFMQLRQAQGLPSNDDFEPKYRKNLRIIKCQNYESKD